MDIFKPKIKEQYYKANIVQNDTLVKTAKNFNFNIKNVLQGFFQKILRMCDENIPNLEFEKKSPNS